MRREPPHLDRNIVLPALARWLGRQLDGPLLPYVAHAQAVQALLDHAVADAAYAPSDDEYRLILSVCDEVADDMDRHDENDAYDQMLNYIAALSRSLG